MTPVGPPFLLALRVFIFLCAFSSSIASFSQDLIVTQVSGTTSFTRYTPLSVSITVKNQGIVSTYRESWIGLFLSDGTTSYYIGDAKVPVLAANESRVVTSAKETIMISPGNYSLIAKADHYQDVTETDESNNSLTTDGYTVTVPDVDFTFTSLVSNPERAFYEEVKIDFSVKNSGTTNIEGISGNFLSTRFYLSTDNNFGGGDILLGDYDGTNLSGRTDVVTASAVFAIPNITPGSYYVIGVADLPAKYAETNEGNNTFANPINIAASDIDLEVALKFKYPDPEDYYYPFDSIKTPTASWRFSGSGTFHNIDLDFLLINKGTTGLSKFQYKLYLSRDEYLSGDDIGAEYYNYYGGNLFEAFVSIAGKDSTIVNTSDDLNLDYLFSSYRLQGSYYVIVQLNPDLQLPESDYNNNLFVSRNTITPHYPTIDVTAASLAKAYTDNDTDLELSVSFKAIYKAEFLKNPWEYFDYHMWYDITICKNDSCFYTTSGLRTFFFTQTDDTLQDTSTETIFLPNPLTAGEYTLKIECDEKEIRPLDCFFSNTLTIPLIITDADAPPPPVFNQLSGNIKGEDGPPISKGKLFLYQKKDDGKVQFIDKITPTTSSNYSFNLDTRQHTLYFIPDLTQYPDYVPTILGKTVTLQESNFITINQNTIRDFEILRVQPLAAGNKSISGNVYVNNESAAASFFAATASLTEPIPVTLLNDAGDPVAVTQTDLDGFYEFKNLPSDKYQLVVALELDDPAAMPEPINVEVTTDSKEVTFDLTTPSAPAISVKKKQFITFTAPPHELTYGDNPVILNASSTSGLAVSYAADNNSVVSLQNNVLTVLKPGTVKLTASHNGNSEYTSAEEEITVTVKKAPLTVSVSDATRYYGDSNPQFSFEYSGFKNNETATVLNVQPVISTTTTVTSKPGTYELDVQGGADDNYELTYKKGKLTISKAPLTVTAFNTSRYYGDPNPTLSLGYSGFRNKETPEVIDVLPKASTEATSASNAGTYDIIITDGADDNYELKYKAGQLTIAKAPLLVTVIDVTIPYNAILPQFKASYAGFKNSETVSVLDSPPVFSAPTLANANAGTVHDVILSDGEDVNYSFTYKNGKATVVKGDLYIQADDKVRKYLESNPTLTFVYSGLKSGEDVQSSGVVLPSVTTTATQNSDAGYYPITLQGGSGGINYNLVPNNGLLTIQKLEQTISFNLAVTNISYAGDPLVLTAESSSGLPVRFVVTGGKEIASIGNDGVTLEWKGKAGKVTISARQSGNVNYKEAPDVSHTINVLPPDDLILGTETPPDAILSAAPNPARNEVVVRSAAENIESVVLYNNLGKVIYVNHEINQNEHRINLAEVSPGIYIVRVITRKNQKTISLAISK